jgi:hypothetical protein
MSNSTSIRDLSVLTLTCTVALVMRVMKIHLLVSGKSPNYQIRNGIVSLAVLSILGHEVVAIDLAA